DVAGHRRPAPALSRRRRRSATTERASTAFSWSSPLRIFAAGEDSPATRGRGRNRRLQRRRSATTERASTAFFLELSAPNLRRRRRFSGYELYRAAEAATEGCSVVAPRPPRL